MKHYEERIIPQHKKMIHKGTSCELCKEKIIGDTSLYNENYVTVKHRKGIIDPDGGGCGTTYEIDICPDCFMNKLIPWVESQGGKVEEREWDF